MRRLDWSRSALADLSNQLAYIAQDDPSAARLVRDRIERAAVQLAEMPTGRPGRVSDTYEKPVPRTSHVIAYAVTDEMVTVLRVIHMARDWPAGRWPRDD